MKVLRVTSSMNPKVGGPCQGIRNIIPALKQLDVENEVVCLDDPDDAYLGRDTFPIHAIGRAKGPWSYNPNLERWILSNVHRFDVVIIHGLWLYSSFATWRAVQKYRRLNPTKNIKIYVMPHGMLDPWFQIAKGRRLKALRNWLYWTIIERNVVNGVDGVLFTCEQELLLANNVFSTYAPRAKINVGYGIQPPPEHTTAMDQAFASACPEVKEESYLLYLSRIHPKKGTDKLVKAYLNLERKGAKLPKLVVAGPGKDTEFGMSIARMALESRSIYLTGMLAGDAKWGALYNCMAFLLPSFQENFGIAIVEALACCKPVLISDRVNIWKEISSGNGGWILSSLDIEDIERHILKIVELDPKDLKAYQESAFNTYEAQFQIGNKAELFKKTIMEITLPRETDKAF
ncbi:glycosyltransferase [Dyadobacter sp.]|uniref:glycosyltransferase n=1 Tax=Dyadobacter sp. TaxID=1914288 RepID=UPI003F704770